MGQSHAANDDLSDVSAFAMRPRVGKKTMFALLLFGGAVLVAVAACAAGGIGIYYLIPSPPPFVGRWELINPPLGDNRTTMEFRANGTGRIQTRATDIDFEFSLLRDDKSVLEWRITHLDRRGFFAMKPMGKRPVAAHGHLEVKENDVVLVGAVTERFRITLLNDLLILQNLNGAPPFQLRRLP